MYLLLRPALAAWALAGYAAVFLSLTLVLVRRRDVLTGRPSRGLHQRAAEIREIRLRKER